MSASPQAVGAGGRFLSLTALAQAAVQIALWAAIAVAFQNSIENDVAEGAVDGPAWQLSYLRHPPLPSWVTGLAEAAGPWRYWALYGAALTFACSAFYVVGRFAARTGGEAAGWVALSGGLVSPYASYWPIKFNHNIAVMPFWALTIFAAWEAFETGAPLAWAALGATVGAGLWAKYALLHLLIPLALLFLARREYRARLFERGPYLALAIAGALIAPHAVDVARKGGTTLAWALHTTPEPLGQRVGDMLAIAVDVFAANLPFALVAWAACGAAPLRRGVAAMFDRATRTPLDLFLTVAAVGPVLVIEAAGPFGVRLYYHWLTAVTVGFAAWWGRAAFRSGLRDVPRRGWIVCAAGIAATAAGFVAVREIAPILSPPRNSAYAEMDAAGLDRAVDAYWRGRPRACLHRQPRRQGRVPGRRLGGVRFRRPRAGAEGSRLRQRPVARRRRYLASRRVGDRGGSAAGDGRDRRAPGDHRGRAPHRPPADARPSGAAVVVARRHRADALKVRTARDPPPRAASCGTGCARRRRRR